MLELFALFVAATTEPTIVVTARRPTEVALEACLKRRCSVRDDATASILHAQTLFADGKYPAARKILQASLARNRNAVDEDPRALSALWYALGRVTLHDGDMVEYRRAVLRSAKIMANASGVTPEERQIGEIELGDAFAANGNVAAAKRHYLRVGKLAADQGDQELAQLMTLRAINAQSGIHGRLQVRNALLRALEKPNLTPRARTVATAMVARLEGGDINPKSTRLDSVAVQTAEAPPLLLWAPKDKFTEQREALARAAGVGDPTLERILLPTSGEMKFYRWVDIGFWIRPSGQVEDIQLLKGMVENGWVKDVVQLIQGRRYAPFEAPPGAPGRYKVERVTLTYEHMVPRGSLVRRRSGLPSYQFEDVRIEDASLNGASR
jgi:hypothetical protein